MPELPEVEIIRKTLSPHLLGRKITAVDVYLDRMIKYPSVEEFVSGIKGYTINNVLRRGKYLLFSFDNQKLLVVHLRLTGALIATKDDAAPNYAKIKFSLSDGHYLWYTDVRTLGTLHLLNKGENNVIKGLRELGPDPLNGELKASYLIEAAKKRKTTIKGFLLDQTVVAGIGNIYADEALALAKIRPDRKANEVSEKEIKTLHKAIIEVIEQGVRNNGTTFRDYKDGDGNQGSNQEHLLVYGRSKESCRTCGTIIEYKRVAGRGTSYCPKCQV